MTVQTYLISASAGGLDLNSAVASGDGLSLKEARPAASDKFAVTGGYHRVGDGGGARYVKVNAQPSHEAKIQDANGGWWELDERRVNPRMLGALGDGTDDATIVNNTISLCVIKNALLDLGIDTFTCASTIKGKSGLRMRAESGLGGLKAHASLSSSVSLFDMETMSGTINVFENVDVSCSGVTFDGSDRAITSFVGLVRFGKVDGLDIRDCVFKRHRYITLAILGCRSVRLSGNKFRNWGRTDNLLVLSPLNEGGSAIYVAGNFTDLTESANVWITDNDFADGEWVAGYIFAKRVIIRGNQARDIKEAMFYTRRLDSTFDAEQLIICDNIGTNISRKIVQAALLEIGAKDAILYANIGSETDGPVIALTDVSERILAFGNFCINGLRDQTNFAIYSQLTIGATAATAHVPADIAAVLNVIRDDRTIKLAAHAIGAQRISGAESFQRLLIALNNVTEGGADDTSLIYHTPGAWGSGSIVADNIGDKTRQPFIGFVVLTAAVASQSITGIGFRPRLVEIFAVVSSSTVNSFSKGARADSSIGSYCSFGFGDGTGFFSGVVTGKIVHLVQNAGVTLFEAGLSSFDEDGFTLDKTTAGTAPTIVYVCHP